MGLLTNPNTGNSNVLLQALENHHGKLGILSYLISLIWIGFLASTSYNLKTHFSENALLPGLVVEHFNQGNQISDLITELSYKDNSEGGLKNEDILKLFRDMGLDEVESQNFTLIHPIKSIGSTNSEGVVRGVNSFAVLRAKRAAGTESLIFNAPYFSKNSRGRKNIAGIAALLALANYFKQQVYWAKDIVFIVADGHLGSLAWIKGHHEIRDDNKNLVVENVRTKAGNIQAAINFILEGSNICHMETKFHGVNGQLPNLDLVNLLNKFVNQLKEYEKVSSWELEFKKLTSYIQTQATGTPSGSHGFFLKYGIESATLVGRSGNCRNPISFGNIGRIIEATFRSLNNLLEKFHQSYFFYLKTSQNRFVSIGLYFPPLALALLAIPIKAASIWLTVSDLETTIGLFYLSLVHFISITCRWSLSHLHLFIPPQLEITPHLFGQIVLGLGVLQTILITILVRPQNLNVAQSIYCFSLLELGTSLFTLGLFNPSLVLLFGVFSTPFLTMFFLFQPGNRKGLSGGTLALLVGGLSYAYANYFESLISPAINKYYYESEVYGNFLFDFIFLLFLPLVSCINAMV